jgi:hypothetical protein
MRPLGTKGLEVRSLRARPRSPRSFEPSVDWFGSIIKERMRFYAVVIVNEHQSITSPHLNVNWTAVSE